MGPVTSFSVKDVAIGRIKGEGIVRIDARLEYKTQQAPYTTVEHEGLPGFWEFAVSGSIWARTNSSDCHTAGQICDDVARLNTPLARRLVALWRAWHLNGMQAGCAHQGKPAMNGPSYDLDSVAPCELSGYRFGRAWLVKPIPADVFAEMQAVIAELAALQSKSKS